ncbi:MAG: glycosyltransferase [Candidatus Saccharimonas sp.]
MRIGLFSDTYRPTINGITYVVETLKQQLEAEGHEVFVFCPAKTIRPSKIQEMTEEDHHIIRIPSFPSGFFDDFDISLFFPPRTLHQIRDMELDIVHIFTPSQIGLLGVNAAMKYDIPFIVQHSTDLYQFMDDYPNVLPGALALINIVFPFSIKLQAKDFIEIAKLQRPRKGAAKWGRDIIERALTMVYSKADAVIALSRKSKDQLEGWQDKDYHYNVTLLPSGVDAIPRPTKKEVEAFRTQWGFAADDEIYGFVGRLGEEKNLPILIKAFDKVAKVRPRAKLLFVGDFDYRETLESMAAQSKYPDRIVFTGAIPRERLGVVYATLDVFTFPSLKDTQGWVLHEAAHAHLPIVLIDRGLSEVFVDGENGYYAKNNATDMARQIVKLLEDPSLRERFGRQSKLFASRYTEKKQLRKITALYDTVVKNHYQQTRKKESFRRLRGALKRAHITLLRYYDDESHENIYK